MLAPSISFITLSSKSAPVIQNEMKSRLLLHFISFCKFVFSFNKDISCPLSCLYLYQFGIRAISLFSVHFLPSSYAQPQSHSSFRITQTILSLIRGYRLFPNGYLAILFTFFHLYLSVFSGISQYFNLDIAIVSFLSVFHFNYRFSNPIHCHFDFFSRFQIADGTILCDCHNLIIIGFSALYFRIYVRSVPAYLGQQLILLI